MSTYGRSPRLSHRISAMHGDGSCGMRKAVCVVYVSRYKRLEAIDTGIAMVKSEKCSVCGRKRVCDEDYGGGGGEGAVVVLLLLALAAVDP